MSRPARTATPGASGGARALRFAPAAALGAGAALLLAGCAPTVSLAPAPAATDPGCAAIVVRLPAVVAGAARRETDAQGTAAWGSPASVLLHCGVPVPGPTTDRCISIDHVDWVEDASRAPLYTYRTYGRDPATEVTIDTGAVSGSTALTDLSSAVAVLPARGACVGAEDVTPPP